MKIAHVCPFYDPAIGGVRQVVEELAKRQVAEGHEVHIFTSDWDKEKRIKTPYEVKSGIHIHRCFHIFRAGNFGTVWPSLFPKLLKGKFDIVHSHLFAHVHFVLSALASKLSGAKHIHTTHCPWSDAHRPTLGKILMLLSYNTLSRLSLKLTDKIIAITPWEKNFIKKFGGIEEKIVVLPNGMAKQFFTKIKNNDFKKRNKISSPIVLFFGRLNETKRPDNFVRIAKLTLKKNPKITFIILGPDEGMKKEVIRLIGNEKRIILLPETRDRIEVLKMYQATDIYVLPSYREGLPLTLFEAMASGLPIVASPVNGIPYEIKEPENGFLVKRDNLERFSKKIIELLENKKLREKISKNNIKKSENYSWDIISEKTLKVYEDSLKY
jgi:glycosyltransferase involved in cell wall biosynthesis